MQPVISQQGCSICKGYLAFAARKISTLSQYRTYVRQDIVSHTSSSQTGCCLDCHLWQCKHSATASSDTPVASGTSRRELFLRSVCPVTFFRDAEKGNWITCTQPTGLMARHNCSCPEVHVHRHHNQSKANEMMLSIAKILESTPGIAVMYRYGGIEQPFR